MIHSILSASVALCAFGVAFCTSLDDYVAKPDNHYSWVGMGEEYQLNGTHVTRDISWTGYYINLTSQAWLTDEVFASDSDCKSVWWHMLFVVVPSNVAYSRNATMYVSGMSNNNALPGADDEDIKIAAYLAMGTQAVSAVLFHIPNQHTTFADDPDQVSRSEDKLIAYTWDHFLKDPSQPEWLLRFPMVKASLRAMDTITAFVAQKFPEENYSLDYYSVMGASKRGWTTWLVGAVDPERVVAIVPIVLDAINFVEVMHHQFRSYGGWSWALNDYYVMNITARFDDPNMALLQEQVDPYWYKERLTVPKMVVNAGMDEFQQPDE